MERAALLIGASPFFLYVLRRGISDRAQELDRLAA